MSRLKRNLVLVTLMIIPALLTSPLEAGTDKQQRKDKSAFTQLLKKRQEVHRRYTQAILDGKHLWKEYGKIPYRQQSIILHERDERDRVEARVMSLALRYGWEVPELTEAPEPAGPPEELTQVFHPARDLVMAELNREVHRFVAEVDLPVKQVTFNNKK